MFDSYNIFQKNQRQQWAFVDSEAKYTPVQKDGLENYSPDDISYKYNSDGFRSDEFDAHSDLSILFAGNCFTEGQGLPLSHTWPYYIIEALTSLPNNQHKAIPFKSIALSSTGIDFLAEELYKHIHKIQPKLVLGYLNSFYSRACCIDIAKPIEHWQSTCRNPYLDEYADQLNTLLLVDAFAIHQCYRSLQIIDLTAQKYNTAVMIFYRESEDHLVKELKSIPFERVQLHKLNAASNDWDIHVELPNQKRQYPTMARDEWHPGPGWQYLLANEIWSKVTSTVDVTLL